MRITIPLRLNEAKRECGTCTLCCKVYNVQLSPDLMKPKDEWCLTEARAQAAKTREAMRTERINRKALTSGHETIARS